MGRSTLRLDADAFWSQPGLPLPAVRSTGTTHEYVPAFSVAWGNRVTLSLIISSNSSPRPGQLNPSLFLVKAFCKWFGKGLRSEPLWSQRKR